MIASIASPLIVTASRQPSARRNDVVTAGVPPGTVAKWLEERMPKPIEDEAAWFGEPDEEGDIEDDDEEAFGDLEDDD